MNNQTDFSKLNEFKEKCAELAQLVSELDCPKLKGYEDKIKNASDEKIAQQIQIFEKKLDELYKSYYVLFARDVTQLQKAVNLLKAQYSKSHTQIYKTPLLKKEIPSEEESEFEEITGVQFELEPRYNSNNQE